MMRETAHEIERVAADWAAKVDRGLSADEQSDLDTWLAADPRRAGAYGRMRAVALRTERAAALGPTYQYADFASSQPARLSRRTLIGGGATIAVSAVLGVAAWVWRIHNRLQTRKGEIRQFALEDGSVVTLNTSSTLSVSFSQQRREVQLLSGEVLFDIAHDKTRPFLVTAGATVARAVGTSFTVRHLPGEGIQVLVREGIVEITRTDLKYTVPLRIIADMRAISSTVTPKSERMALSALAVPQAEMQRALAWRDGRIAFEGETLATAAREFARYSDTRIVVEDPSLAREEIAGLFQANDPVGFARSVAVSLNARTEVSEGEVRIFRPMS